jgi:hypothetical protein
MKCVEVASAIVADHYKAKKPPEHTIVEWLEAFQRCEDFPKPKEPCKHEPREIKVKTGWIGGLFQPKLGDFDREVLSESTETYIQSVCRHCGIKLKAKWDAAV